MESRYAMLHHHNDLEVLFLANYKTEKPMCTESHPVQSPSVREAKRKEKINGGCNCAVYCATF